MSINRARVCQFDARISELVRNLCRLYNRERTESDTLLGSSWYPNARAIVREWSDSYALPVRTVANVVAALSPQNEWSRNLIQADDVLAERPLSIRGLMSSELKARRMLRERAEHIREYFPQGPKVFHFAENLAGCETAVTVDTHAMQAALDDVLASYRLAWRPYLVFASAYVRASERCKVSPATFQAIIWHVWKRKHPRASKLNARKQWVVIATEDE